MITKDYIKQALWTESNDWPKIRERFQNTYVLGFLHDTMGAAHSRAQEFDALKKFFYYGKGSIYAERHAPLDWADHPGLSERLQDEKVIRLLHAVIGLSTEIGELIEAVFKHVFDGEALDHVNVVEECGDLDWYFAMLHAVMGMDPEDVMARNIAKLKKRYPDKFSEERATVRDLDAERQVLEGPPKTEMELEIEAMHRKIQQEQDLLIYGNAFTDQDGKRVDPMDVVLGERVTVDAGVPQPGDLVLDPKDFAGKDGPATKAAQRAYNAHVAGGGTSATEAALRAAIFECHAHNCDYDLVTSNETLSTWADLARLLKEERLWEDHVVVVDSLVVEELPPESPGSKALRDDIEFVQTKILQGLGLSQGLGMSPDPQKSEAAAFVVAARDQFVNGLEGLPEKFRLPALRALLFDIMCEYEQEQVGDSAAVALRNVDCDLIPPKPVAPVTAEELERRRQARKAKG